MPAAVVGLAGLIGGAAAAVASAVAGIASLIGGAVAGLTSAVAGIAGSVVGTIGSVVGGVTSFLGDVGKFLTGSLNFDLAGIAKSIADTASGIASGLTTAIKAVTVPATKIITVVKKEFIGRWVEIQQTIDNVAYPILNPIKETLETVKTVVDAVKEPVDAIMEPVKLMRETISDISSLKIIGDVLDGTAKVSDLLGPVAEGQTVETAAAIAELTKAIATTTVSTIDKVDVEFKMLGATIDTFDERIKTSVAEKVAVSKAEILAKVTPRLDVLGSHQAKVISGIARLTRPIEDETSFMFMLLRALG